MNRFLASVARQTGGPLSLVLRVFDFEKNDARLGLNFARIMLRDRFLGSSLGSAWAVLNPVVMLLLFWFVFSVVYKSRLPGSNSSLSYVIWMFSGYGPWLANSEAIVNGTNSVVSQGSVIKNMAFKTEILPFSAAAVAVVPMAVSFVMVLILLLLDGRGPNLTWTILPIVLMLQMGFVIGIGLVLGSSQVFVRDIAQILPNLLTLMLFLSPIFYPLEQFPAAVRPIAELNPFYLIANCYREPILSGHWPPPLELFALVIWTVGSMCFGLWYFRRLKNYFTDRI